LETDRRARTDNMNDTLRLANIYFYVCPGTLDPLPPGFLDAVNRVFESVFGRLIGKIGPLAKKEWRKAITTYARQVCEILNEFIARPALTMVAMPLRASARMGFYLHRLSATMYIPTATALVKTAEQLFGVGLGICEVSVYANDWNDGVDG